MGHQCPNCPDQRLATVALADALEGEGCAVCGGVLLALAAWRRWRDRRLGSAAAPVSRSAKAQVETVTDSRLALTCPICRATMTKYRLVADARNQIDFCANCDAVWLDRGEWSMIEQFALSEQLGQILTVDWQKRLRASEARQRQESRYREIFGEDYARLREIRGWISRHPRGREILAYLYLSQTGADD